MASLEGLRLKINKYLRLKYANKRQNELNNKDFTIISNNCWGGMIYESYNLEKQSPTVGLFFMAKDYIDFISNLRENLDSEISFINPKDSKYYNELKGNKKFGTYPIGKIGDIEIMFLHYKSQKEAYEKWTRRKKRVNFEKLIIKFNDQNGCTQNDIDRFMNLEYKNKLFFTTKKWKNINKKYTIKVFQLFNKKYINSSMEPFGKRITNYINQIDEK